MSTEQGRPTEHRVNWTPVIVGGTVLGGGFLLYKMLQTVFGGKEADHALAREIMEDWQQEWDVFQPYMESTYYAGRVPTESEVAILSAMLDQMRIKEITIQGISTPVFQEFQELAAEVAAGLWLTSKAFALLTLSGIGGYITYKIVREWKNRRGPPPNFPCPICGSVHSTAGSLEVHVAATHPVTTQYLIQAQTEFHKLHTWVQNAVAVEYFYDRTYSNWSHWLVPELQRLNWNVISTGVYGIGSSLILYRVAFWMVGIPI